MPSGTQNLVQQKIEFHLVEAPVAASSKRESSGALLSVYQGRVTTYTTTRNGHAGQCECRTRAAMHCSSSRKPNYEQHTPS